VAGLALKLVVGLGNPGRKYARTRHNVGWWWLDELAERFRGSWQLEPREHREQSRIQVEGSELWLLKPTSFMNNSGGPTAAMAKFYRVAPAEMLVVHDEIDLPPGIARLKYGGGHGGHNGVRDVIAHLGADFWRLRLGVGHPGSKDLVIGSVLDRPTGAEQDAIDDAVSRSLNIFPELVRSGAEKAMHTLHSSNPKSPIADT
jgi:PTH1 family peptidyl-tRNA hydrolase